MAISKTTPFGSSQTGLAIRELDNGKLVCITRNSSKTTFYVWVSTNFGISWTQQTSWTNSSATNLYTQNCSPTRVIDYNTELLISDTIKRDKAFYVPVSGSKMRRISYNSTNDTFNVSSDLTKQTGDPVRYLSDYIQYTETNNSVITNYPIIITDFYRHSNRLKFDNFSPSSSISSDIYPHKTSDTVRTTNTNELQSAFINWTLGNYPYPPSMIIDWTHTGDGTTPQTTATRYSNKNIAFITNLLYTSNSNIRNITNYYTLRKNNPYMQDWGSAHNRNIGSLSGSTVTLSTTNKYGGIGFYNGENIYIWNNGSNGGSNPKLSLKRQLYSGYTGSWSYIRTSSTATNNEQFWKGISFHKESNKARGIILENTSSGKILGSYVMDVSTRTWGNREEILLDNTAVTGISNHFREISLDVVKYPYLNALYALDVDKSNPNLYRIGTFGGNPDTPSLKSPVRKIFGTNEPITFSWDFKSDYQTTQEAYELKRVSGGVTGYWNGSSWVGTSSSATRVVSTTSSVTLTSSQWRHGTGDHKFSIKVWDNSDVNSGDGYSSSFSSEITISIQSPPVTAISKINNETYTTGDTIVLESTTTKIEWTSDVQDSYLIEIYEDNNGSIDTTKRKHNFGWKTGTNKSFTVPSSNLDVFSSETFAWFRVTSRKSGVIGNTSDARFQIDDREPPYKPTILISNSDLGINGDVVDDISYGKNIDLEFTIKELVSGSIPETRPPVPGTGNVGLKTWYNLTSVPEFCNIERKLNSGNNEFKILVNKKSIQLSDKVCMLTDTSPQVGSSSPYPLQINENDSDTNIEYGTVFGSFSSSKDHRIATTNTDTSFRGHLIKMYNNSNSNEFYTMAFFIRSTSTSSNNMTFYNSVSTGNTDSFNGTASNLKAITIPAKGILHHQINIYIPKQRYFYIWFENNTFCTFTNLKILLALRDDGINWTYNYSDYEMRNEEEYTYKGFTYSSTQKSLPSD